MFEDLVCNHPYNNKKITMIRTRISVTDMKRKQGFLVLAGERFLWTFLVK